MSNRDLFLNYFGFTDVICLFRLCFFPPMFCSLAGSWAVQRRGPFTVGQTGAASPARPSAAGLWALEGRAARPWLGRSGRLGISVCEAVFPGRKSGFPAGFRPDSSREFQNRPSGRPKASRSADFETSPIRIGSEADPETRKHYFITYCRRAWAARPARPFGVFEGPGNFGGQVLSSSVPA
jgi:hypothetical protein